MQEFFHISAVNFFLFVTALKFETILDNREKCGNREKTGIFHCVCRPRRPSRQGRPRNCNAAASLSVSIMTAGPARLFPAQKNFFSTPERITSAIVFTAKDLARPRRRRGESWRAAPERGECRTRGPSPSLRDTSPRRGERQDA